MADEKNKPRLRSKSNRLRIVAGLLSFAVVALLVFSATLAMPDGVSPVGAGGATVDSTAVVSGPIVETGASSDAVSASAESTVASSESAASAETEMLVDGGEGEYDSADADAPYKPPVDEEGVVVGSVLPAAEDVEPVVEEHVAGSVLVEVNPDMTPEEITTYLQALDYVQTEQITEDDIMFGFVALELAPDASVEQAMAALEETEFALYVQPDYIMYASDVPVPEDESDEVDAADQPKDPSADDELVEPSAEGAQSDEPAEPPADAESGIDPEEQPVGDSSDNAGEEASDEAAAGSEPSEPADSGESEATPAQQQTETEAAPESNAQSDTESASPSSAKESSAEDKEQSADAQPKAEADNDEDGDSAESDGQAQGTAYAVNDPMVGDQWWLDAIKAPEAWNLVKTNHAVTVAVLDSGCDVSLVDLKDNIIAPRNFLSYGSWNDVRDESSISHGTIITSIIAAEADNKIIQAGVSFNAYVMPVRVMKPDLTVSYATALEGMNYVSKMAQEHPEYNIRVVNLSFGGRTDDAALLAGIETLRRQGIVIVTAAGNLGGTDHMFPTDASDYYLGVINLQRSGKNFVRYYESNYNAPGKRTKNISAPGTDIVTEGSQDAQRAYWSQFVSGTGTSFAAPMVSGVLALVFTANPDLTGEQARQIILTSAQDLGPQGFDVETGYGMVDAYAAVKAAQQTLVGGDSVIIGSSLQLRLPSGASDSVTWKSSNSSVAAVDSSGRVTGASLGSVTITATSKSGTKWQTTVTVKARTITSSDVSSGTSFTYTGKEIKPTVTVVVGGKTLKNGTDYTVTYSNNLKVGTGSYTVVGKGNYTGKVTKKFTIKSNGSTSGSATNWKRLWGDTALDTMSRIVDEGAFPKGGAVILTTVGGYWDALTAAGVAGLTGAPVLMTDGEELSPQTRAQIAKLAPKTVIVCGGTAAVSNDTVNAAVKAAGSGAKSVRLWGQDAIETAENIYLKGGSYAQGGAKWSDTAFVCTSNGYWDALSAAPVSYSQHMPIFLTLPDGSIDSGTLSVMKQGGIKKVYIVGGTVAVPASTANDLKNAGFTISGRFAGADALETSELVATYGLSLGLSANKMGVATVGGYWDALAGAALCGKNGSVLVLVSDKGSSTISGFVKKNSSKIATGYIFGGTAAVDSATESALKSVTK